jgi:hypothetical protein
MSNHAYDTFDTFSEEFDVAGRISVNLVTMVPGRRVTILRHLASER